jgi:hypothetical protein
MPQLELFPFRYRDRVAEKTVCARYRAERREIQARCAEWEINHGAGGDSQRRPERTRV